MAGGRTDSGGGCVVWLTGLSGSSKSTLGHALEQRLPALLRTRGFAPQDGPR
jgi:adenylylsulfate kinase-like enzyme